MRINVKSMHKNTLNLYSGELIVDSIVTSINCEFTAETEGITIDGNIQFEGDTPNSFEDAEKRIKELFKGEAV